MKYFCHVKHCFLHFRFAKLKQEKQHVMFPGEIDTPQDLPARTRFQK
jgi:hypothetical protein